MQLADLTWPAVGALSPSTPVVVPVAALEQHGHHLPVFTDSLLLGELVRRLQVRHAGPVLFAPLLWLGNSEHHLDFPGTLSAAPRTYLDLLKDLGRNLIHHGFRRIVFLNGHGGNDVPGRQALFELRQELRLRQDLLLLFATYWQVGHGAEPLPVGLHQSEMGHACEWETSMILRLNPDLVGDYRAAMAVESGVGFPGVFRAWTTRDRSGPGHIGHPALATAEKGEALFQYFESRVSSLLTDVCRWDGSTWDR